MSRSVSLLGRGKRGVKPFDHSLIGYNVCYLGRVWKVISAHRADPNVEPWLTLRRGNTEVAAKPQEVEPAFD